MHTGVDEAVLAALSDADRAAVLAAMSGAEQAEAPEGAPAEGSAPGAEDIPKFDCQGSTDQLQVCPPSLLKVAPSAVCAPCYEQQLWVYIAPTGADHITGQVGRRLELPLGVRVPERWPRHSAVFRHCFLFEDVMRRQ